MTLARGLKNTSATMGDVFYGLEGLFFMASFNNIMYEDIET